MIIHSNWVSGIIIYDNYNWYVTSHFLFSNVPKRIEVDNHDEASAQNSKLESKWKLDILWNTWKVYKLRIREQRNYKVGTL